MPDKLKNTVDEIVARFDRDPWRLLDILREIQATLGHISEDSIGRIAAALEMHRVQVRDTLTFYSFLSREPVGKTVIRLCRAVPERMKGADEVARTFEETLGTPFGGTTPDGAIGLEYTSCIGLSDQAPSALVDGIPLTDLQPEDVPQIVETIRSGSDVSRLTEAKVEQNIHKAGPVIFAPTIRGRAVWNVVTMEPDEVINELNKARLRGRGGAGFPTATKWNFCRQAKGDARYIICNADEGEPGTFKDRVILVEHPNLVFGGMTVAGYALGAKEGILYLRGEYAYMLRDLEQVLAKRRHLGLLGDNICGKELFDFDIRIQVGAGAYICGEESALIESLEGKRGAPRHRPPYPVQRGYRGQPTVVNNVETLCCAARIMVNGAEWFSKMGTKDSTGTKVLSVSGDCERPGIYEVEYGISVGDVLDMAGAKDAQAIQVGGPSGSCLAPKDFGRSISFEDLPTGGSMIIFGPDRDILEHMRQFTEFFAEESCGWCVPCRVGTRVLVERFGKILDGKGTRADLEDLEHLALTVKKMSRCGLGQTAANPLLTTMRNFPHLYTARIRSEDFAPPFDLEKPLEEGRAAAGRTPGRENHVP